MSKTQEEDQWMSKTDVKNGINFQYPSRFADQSFSSFNGQEQKDGAWLQVDVTPGTFSCKEATGYSADYTTKQAVINGRQYCVSVLGDEGTGKESYETYKYMTELSGKLITFTFTVTRVNCSGAFEAGTENFKKCKQEQETSDLNFIDTMVDRIAQSVKFTN